MGDSRRFTAFAKLIRKEFPPIKYPRVADIAGGKGVLNLALQEAGYIVHTYDKRNNRKLSRQSGRFSYRFFNANIKESFNLLVGMHPDEATDVIIVEAGRRKIPFVVCPCCILPTATVLWEQYTFSNWIRHLRREATRRGFIVEERTLRITGKNLVLIGRLM